MERYLKDEPKLQSYKKLPTELDTAPWNLFRAPPISWTASTGTTNAQFESPIKMEVSIRIEDIKCLHIGSSAKFHSLRVCLEPRVKVVSFFLTSVFA